ncbi:putative 26S proteasome regulatory subunit [Ophidiomyces ophidiicola]|nr:putative 26S proteasome regulatory subunit [Ophidiomyces ophidiicola]
MGIPMDELHAPTVPSGPTSGTGGGRDISRLSINELYHEKENIEAELKALSGILQSHGVTMETPLLTFDGYPRNDLDIAQIRTTRSRIIHLRNDHKAVMSKLEQGVHAYFADIKDREARGEMSGNAPMPVAVSERTDAASGQNDLEETPFVRVNSVADGSPAAQAGLKAGDKIRSFGTVNWMNHENLKKISEVVTNNEGVPLIVKVVRPSEPGQNVTDLILQLTPRRDWGGRGLLGCHLVPL